MNTNKLVTIATLALFIVGVLFKIELWSGASLIIIAGLLSALVMSYMTLTASKESGDHLPLTWLIVLAVLPCIVFPVFRIMHWPGADIGGMVGTGLLILAGLIAAFSSESKTVSRGLVNHLLICIACLTCLILLLKKPVIPADRQVEKSTEQMESSEMPAEQPAQ